MEFKWVMGKWWEKFPPQTTQKDNNNYKGNGKLKKQRLFVGVDVDHRSREISFDLGVR